MEGGFTWRRALIACAIYAVAGKLATLMAIPPGYATAVWPAAGFALAFVLVWGPRMAPAIVLGSFLVNVGTSFDASSAAALARSLAIASAIGIGAALQTLIGARLLVRHVGFPLLLESAREVVRFAVWGGFVSCVTNALIGVSTLCISGAVPWSEFAFSAWTWWVGDTIGVLIFAPLALLLMASTDAVSPHRRRLVTIPLILGFIGVTWLFVQVSAWEGARLRADFEARARPVGLALAARLANDEALAGFLVSFFDASEHVTRSEFRTYTTHVLAHTTGMLAVSWNPVVRDPERARYEADARAAGLSSFEITEPGPSGPITASRRPYYVSVDYLEPAEGNNTLAYGLDIAADPVRRAALERAASSGRTSVTSRLTLVQGDIGVLLVAPVLRFAASSSSAWQPRAIDELRGFVVVALGVGDVLASALRGVDLSGLDVVLSDMDAPEGMHALHVRRDPEPRSSSTPWSHVIALGGRRWAIDVSPAATLRSWQAWLVLACGLAVVSLLGMVMLLSTGRTSQTERHLEAQTRAEIEQERLMSQLTTLNGELEDRVQHRTRELTALLQEREVLLQEVHHRVRNNLQVISSLIRLQVRKLDLGAHQDALMECEQRVQAIALVHETLYQSKNYARVQFAEYARGLATNVFRTMGAPDSKVSLELAIEDLALAVDRAIPCGLVLNELVSNALKHAFPQGGAGTIRVEMARGGDGLLRLAVRDDGVGLPAGLDLENGRSMGLQLIRALSQQLDAKLEVQGTAGASFQLTFASEG